jgi:hypothetical protein
LASHVEFFFSKDLRVYAAVSTVKMDRQTCEVRLSCESWAFSPVKSAWKFTFDGDHPSLFGHYQVESSNAYSLVLVNGIRGDYREPAIIQTAVITTVCPIDQCTTKMLIEVEVTTKQLNFPSEKKPLTLFH